MSLTLPVTDEPELSVVMVTHGAWPLIERAIAALVDHTQRPFELIVVDNASDEATRAELGEVQNVQLLSNEQNRGFGPASNQGAHRARGEYLVLLNSDAFVEPGWVEPLLETVARPGVAAVVPRILHPEGSLQEAGGLLARDGTVLLYGDGDDPDLGCYRFSRRVDYGSAVCMAMRHSTFSELGGFDESYTPAYYEDADFCMRLAARGVAVMYEPRARITHVRYGSGGLDAAVALSERNRNLFAERWATHLEGRPPTFTDASEQATIASRDASARPRLLICSGADPTAQEPLVEDLIAAWPRARLTWSTDSRTADRFDRDRWLARGVEVLRGAEASWLDRRLFHYDLVVRANRLGDGLVKAVERTQPQAAVLSPEALDAAALLSAGIAPPDPER
jgi:GT2 family glycosyltransferase